MMAILSSMSGDSFLSHSRPNVLVVSSVRERSLLRRKPQEGNLWRFWNQMGFPLKFTQLPIYRYHNIGVYGGSPLMWTPTRESHVGLVGTCVPGYPFQLYYWHPWILDCTVWGNWPRMTLLVVSNVFVDEKSCSKCMTVGMFGEYSMQVCQNYCVELPLDMLEESFGVDCSTCIGCPSGISHIITNLITVAIYLFYLFPVRQAYPIKQNGPSPSGNFASFRNYIN